MGDKTGIEWTEATWNPVVGCSLQSPGCTNCYAMGEAARLERMGVAKYAGLTKPSKAGAVWTGEVRLHEEALDQPIRWKRPRRIFVNSMSDLFHEAIPDHAIDRVFAVMAMARQHTFQVLTKRADRMKRYMHGLINEPCRVGELVDDMGGNWDSVPTPLPNVWLGVSVEDQRRADERVPDLLATPAAVRFVSMEPLLEAVDVRWALSPNRMDIAAGFLRRGHFAPGLETLRPLDWVIVGGESGPKARPMHPDWARSLRDQCSAAGVPFLFKQHGEFREFDTGSPAVEVIETDDEFSTTIHPADLGAVKPVFVALDGRSFTRFNDVPEGLPVRLMERVGKRAAGRQLDGVIHDGVPQPRDTAKAA